VRDKSLRHGHISTLHLWWARRPLAAARGIVFASLVPDPDDANCPPKFREAVVRLLKTKLPSALKAYRRGTNWVNDGDPYRPYDGIPDTPRNRLLTFIGKFSPEYLAWEQGKYELPKGKKTFPADLLLDDRSLVKWETSDPENPQGREVLRVARELVTTAYDGKVSTVLDPFSGGGSIPLEATRLGCQAIANDYNPVAYLILRATCEFPQRYGQRLVRDVEHWAKWILEGVRQPMGLLYPPGKGGQPVIGYLWARTAPCSNPACRAEIPLLRSLLLCDKAGKRFALRLSRRGENLTFDVVNGREIQTEEGTMLERGDCRCPNCQQVTAVEDLRLAGLSGQMGERMVAVIVETSEGKSYRQASDSDLAAYAEAQKLASKVERPAEYVVPEINAPNAPADAGAHASIRVDLYGFTSFGSLFNDRQLLAMDSLVNAFHDAIAEVEKRSKDKDYCIAVAAYLALWLDRVAQHTNSFCRWNSGAEKIQHIFGRQSLAMIWDYFEVPITSVTAGSPTNLLAVVSDFIAREGSQGGNLRPAHVVHGDGSKLELAERSVEVVVTDPPYFDAIAYADLADFFYVWLKRTVGHLFPEAFATPNSPKSEEAVAHKHRHHGNRQKGNEHFQQKLTACLAEARRVCKPDGVVAVMFAHQATEAWTALVRALFNAGLTITASLPLDTEKTTRLVAMDVSALESSITVICRPREVGPAASFKEVRREIQEVVRESVHRFWDYGFRGADLIVACYGPAVGVFGKHERVERADGGPVDVPTLLELARESALKAIAGEFQGDELSRLYFVWASQYGIAPQPYDDLVKVAQMGTGNESAADLGRQRGLFVVDGHICRLALLRDRTEMKHLGDEPTAPLIDKLHHALRLWKGERRPELVRYLTQQDLLEDAAYWKLAQALFEVLPRGEEDWKLVSALLSERETLQTEARRAVAKPVVSADEERQAKLGLTERRE